MILTSLAHESVNRREENNLYVIEKNENNNKMKVLLRQQYNFEFDGQQQGDINNDNGGDISDNENENTL